MKTIDIFYQGEGLSEIGHTELKENQTFGDLKDFLKVTHELSEDVFLFLEEDEEPVEGTVELGAHASNSGLKVHFHSHRKIEVCVYFNRETVDRSFPPSTTVARVKRWAAERKFEMSEDEASEHVLQLSGTHERPSSSTHIGALVECHDNKIKFDLVPDERVNGAEVAQK